MFRQTIEDGVPEELGFLYELLCSLDERSFVRSGTRHTGGDDLGTRRAATEWLVSRRLLARADEVTNSQFEDLVRARAILRSLLAPDETERDLAARDLAGFSARFPLVVRFGDAAPVLGCASAAPFDSVIARLLHEVVAAGMSGRWERLKMCLAPDCRTVFYDLSRPGRAKWCSAAVCGNRHKTAAYRRRRHARASESRGARLQDAGAADAR